MPLVIAKTVLPDAQKFYLALGRIFGIGKTQGLAIAEEVGISKEARVADVKAAHVRQVGSWGGVPAAGRRQQALCGCCAVKSAKQSRSASFDTNHPQQWCLAAPKQMM